MVSVDVKHHVYLLEDGRERAVCCWDIGEGEKTGLYYKGKERFGWYSSWRGPTPTHEVGRGGAGWGWGGAGWGGGGAGRVEKTIPNATLFTTKMTPVLRWAAMVAFSPDPQCKSKLASQVVYFRNPSGGT